MVARKSLRMALTTNYTQLIFAPSGNDDINVYDTNMYGLPWDFKLHHKLVKHEIKSFPL